MKVLLVEDDVKIATAVKRGLEAEGFRWRCRIDGDDGLWRATEGAYDLLVLDLMLPGRNGFQICAELRAAGDWTPILVLTAKDGDLDEAEALDTGADDYLTKPFSFPVLVSHGAGAAPPDRRPRPGAASTSATCASTPGSAGRGAATRRSSPSRPASSTCSSSSSGGPARCCPRTRSWPACGSTTSTATRTSSRCTSVGSAARSTSRSGATRIETVRGAGYRLDGVASSIRTRITALATVVGAVVLLVAGCRHRAAARAAARARPSTSSSSRPRPPTTDDAVPRPTLLPPGDDDSVAQLVRDGEVVAVAPSRRSRPGDPIAAAAGGARRPRRARTSDGLRRGRGRPTGCCSETWPTARSLHLGVNLDDVRGEHRALQRALVVGHPPGARCLLGGDHLVVRRAGAPPGRGDPEPGRRHRRRRPRPSGARARTADDEIARLARTMNEMLDRLERSARPAATPRRRRLPRAAQPAGADAGRARGRPGPPRAAPTWWRRTAARSTRSSACSTSSTTSSTWPDPRAPSATAGRAGRPRRHRAAARPVGFAPGRAGHARHHRRRRRPGGRATRAGSIAWSPTCSTTRVRHAATTVERQPPRATATASAVLVVADDGPGIAPADRDRAVRAVHPPRRGSHRSGTGGAGLGLAIVRDIAVAHGGSVDDR